MRLHSRLRISPASLQEGHRQTNARRLHQKEEVETVREKVGGEDRGEGDPCGARRLEQVNMMCSYNQTVFLYCAVSCAVGFLLGVCIAQSSCETSAYWNPFAAWRAIKMAESNPFLLFGAPDAISGLKYTSAALVSAGGGWLALGGEAITGRKLDKLMVRKPEQLDIRYFDHRKGEKSDTRQNQDRHIIRNSDESLAAVQEPFEIHEPADHMNKYHYSLSHRPSSSSGPHEGHAPDTPTRVTWFPAHSPRQTPPRHVSRSLVGPIRRVGRPQETRDVTSPVGRKMIRLLDQSPLCLSGEKRSFGQWALSQTPRTRLALRFD